MHRLSCYSIEAFQNTDCFARLLAQTAQWQLLFGTLLSMALTL